LVNQVVLLTAADRQGDVVEVTLGLGQLLRSLPLCPAEVGMDSVDTIPNARSVRLAADIIQHRLGVFASGGVDQDDVEVLEAGGVKGAVLERRSCHGKPPCHSLSMVDPRIMSRAYWSIYVYCQGQMQITLDAGVARGYDRKGVVW
jgi:hypothetical protein